MDEGSSSPGLITRLFNIFGRKSLSDQEKFEEEISDLLDHGAESGAIPKSAGEMIQSIVEFNDIVARKIMTPRIAMVGIEQDATLGEVIRLLQEEGYSRLPVYEGDMDHIIGFLVAKDLLDYWGQPLDAHMPRGVIRPITLVPGNKKIGDILSDLRVKKSHMAVVLDEYGGTAGLITMEDILEEIIGDIHDEYDIDEEQIQHVSPGVSLVSGQINIYDFNEQLNLELPEGDYDTLGGFLTNQVGRVPKEMEEINWDQMTFIIRAADDRRVTKVEVHVKGDHSGEKDGDERAAD